MWEVNVTLKMHSWIRVGWFCPRECAGCISNISAIFILFPFFWSQDPWPGRMWGVFVVGMWRDLSLDGRQDPLGRLSPYVSFPKKPLLIQKIILSVPDWGHFKDLLGLSINGFINLLFGLKSHLIWWLIKVNLRTEGWLLWENCAWWSRVLHHIKN